MANLNIQGIARSSKPLVGTLIADPGKVIVAPDLSAGEPTITHHFCQDPNYGYAVFDGVGKKPFYKDGILMIDDIYLMCSSVYPMTKDLMRKAFDANYNGLTFAEQWLKDPEVIKGILKKPFRALCKAMTLALGYGAGWKKLIEMALEDGFTITAQQAKGIHKNYWDLFSGLKSFAKLCTYQADKYGYIVNAFGFRLTPEPYKAFNAVIQSSASGVIDVLDYKFAAMCPWVDFFTYIHDEIVFQVDIERFEETKELFYKCVDSLNEDLNWKVKIRCGFAAGKTFYEIH